MGPQARLLEIACEVLGHRRQRHVVTEPGGRRYAWVSCRRCRGILSGEKAPWEVSLWAYVDGLFMAGTKRPDALEQTGRNG